MILRCSPTLTRALLLGAAALGQWYWENTVPTPAPGQWLAAPDPSPRDPEYLRCPWGFVPVETDSGIGCFHPNAVENYSR